MSDEINVYLVIRAQIFPINKEITSLGRSLDNDIVLKDENISRRHAEIRIVDNEYRLIDLDSTGGTFLNSKRVKDGVLFSGDIISLSNTPIMFMNTNASIRSETEKTTGSLSIYDESSHTGGYIIPEEDDD